MTSITGFLSNPLLWKIIAAYWLFNALASSLPAPNGNKFYQFFYRFVHTLAGNVDRAAKSFNVPGLAPAGPVDPKA